MGVLTDSFAAVEVEPPWATFPDAVVYFTFGETAVLADLCVPIHDQLAAEGGQS